VRQEFIKNGNWIRNYELDKMCQSADCYKELGSQAAQKIIQLLDKNWVSFFVAVKDYSKNPSKYLGKPRIPKYKAKDGRQILIFKNIQCSLKDGLFRIGFRPFGGYTVRTNITSTAKLIQCRFIPKANNYVMEIVYEIDVPELQLDSEHIASIDLGVDNFATITNNIGLTPIVIKGGTIKSMNQYYNKRKANIQSELMLVNKKYWSKRLQKLTDKRHNRIKTWMHKVSKYIVDYCILYSIDTLVCGYNAGWKQNSDMGTKTNQKFECIPYLMFIQQLAYKCENNGIKFIQVEEDYTSGSSFLDGEYPCKKNYDKSRRICRGLFQSNKGVMINADVNGSYNIMVKAIPNAFTNGIVDVGCHPTAIKVV